MTLREKFKPKVSINTDGEAGRYAKDCEKISDDFAIEFGEWLMKKGRYNIDNWSKTTKELLQIFKKEKGL